MTESVQGLVTDYDTYAKSLTKANEANKLAVFAALKTAAIATVNVQFNGSGDSGQIEEVTALTGKATVALPDAQVEIRHCEWGGKATTRTMLLQEAIAELCFDYLSQEHGGWENNDGGQGEFTFRVEDSSIDLEFEQFYTDSTHHSHTF